MLFLIHLLTFIVNVSTWEKVSGTTAMGKEFQDKRKLYFSFCSEEYLSRHQVSKSIFCCSHIKAEPSKKRTLRTRETSDMRTRKSQK